MSRIVVVLFALLVSTAPLAAASLDHKKIIRTSVDNHILPRFDRLRATTARLTEATKTFCDETPDDDLLALKEPFREVAVAWSHAQHLRWGPASKDNRYSRMAFGADPKNYVGRQLKQLIKKLDPDDLKAKSFRKKSVAIQGLTALELLIHSKRKSPEWIAYRCALAGVITANMATIASNMVAEWGDRDGYVATMLSPGPENNLFRTPEESVMSIFKPLSGGLRFMIDIKLKDPLRDSAKNARTKHLEFRRSAMSLAMLKGYLVSLEALYRDGGISEEVKSRNAALNRNIFDAFARARVTVDDIALPLKAAITDATERSKLAHLTAILEGLWKLIAYDAAGTLGLTIGFNEFDGD